MIIYNWGIIPDWEFLLIIGLAWFTLTLTCIPMANGSVISNQERLKKLNIELESELNADFIDWKKYYDLREEIRKIENGSNE